MGEEDGFAGEDLSRPVVNGILVYFPIGPGVETTNTVSLYSPAGVRGAGARCWCWPGTTWTPCRQSSSVPWGEPPQMFCFESINSGVTTLLNNPSSVGTLWIPCHRSRAKPPPDVPITGSHSCQEWHWPGIEASHRWQYTAGELLPVRNGGESQPNDRDPTAHTHHQKMKFYLGNVVQPGWHCRYRAPISTKKAISLSFPDGDIIAIQGLIQLH